MKAPDHKGELYVPDGLDGIGKGVIEDELEKHFREKGLRIFNQTEFEKEHEVFPNYFNPESRFYVNPEDFDVVRMAEPTYTKLGQFIRFHVIHKDNKGVYSARQTLESYSLDRKWLFEQCVIPLLTLGKKIIKSRSVVSSMCYQGLMATEEKHPLTYDEIFSLPGNRLSLEYRPDILIIPTITDPVALQERLSERKKQDDSFLESIEFQLPLKPWYEDPKIRELFQSRGSRVEYLDAGLTIEDTRRQTREIILK